MSFKERVGRSFNTVVEMLVDRNFLSEEELEITRALSHNELNVFANKPIFNLDIGDKVRIVYIMNKFKMPDFKPFVETGDFTLYVVVSAEKLTTNNLKSINEFEKKSEVPINMQFFELREMLFNITKHVLVPKHEVIKDEAEIAALVEAYNVKGRHHFPIILKSDPIAKYYGMKSGQLVKITRVSPSAGDYFIYRCCV
jgi:DNA-directed RNA polymerase subunit H (RpoH/RPB5)